MTAEKAFEQAQAAHRAGNIAEAERLYRAALKKAPDNAVIQCSLAILFFQQGDAVKAEPYLTRAAALAPNDPFIQQNYAMVLNALVRPAEAIAAADRAIRAQPNFALAWFNRGQAQNQLGNAQGAIADFEKAAGLGLNNPVLYYDLGHAQIVTGRRNEALASWNRAVALKPDFIQAIVNRGVLLKEMGHQYEALAQFERAIALNPDIALSHFNAGLIFLAQRRDGEALKAFDKAMALAPDMNWLEGVRFYSALQVCDWRDYEARCRSLLSHVDAGKRVAQPFQILLLPASLAQQRKAAEIYMAEACPPRPAIRQNGPRQAGRLRIAYLSKDFNANPVAYLLAEILERHDRAAFEIFILSHGSEDGSTVRQRIADAAEHFENVGALDDKAVATRIAALNIDILVQLDGHTEDARPGIAAFRPAPLQVSYLGYPGTTGAPHIDYLIADKIVAPPEHQPFYSEKLVWLPGCYLPATPRPASKPLTRTEAGLPDHATTFCAFNSSYKISPGSFAAWMRILARVPDSILWLRDGTELLKKNLRAHARDTGIDPARLIFAPRAEAGIHFSRLALADLYLDTFLYGAHTTAGDALWSGAPVVTLRGETFARRVAASLLEKAGLPELIAPSPTEYENLAVALATDKARLASLKQKLAELRPSLFDAALFTRHLEEAYSRMSARHQAGERPEGFAL